jgi:hypothetical protein
MLFLLGSVSGCATRPLSTPAGVAPEGVYSFSGTVDGEVVTGTLEFADPILLSSSHGQCVRQIQGMRRWGGPFSVTCPGFSLVVRVQDDGQVQKAGIARLKKPGWREERTSCRTYNETTNTCVAWNTMTVEYDRWVEGQVRVEKRVGTALEDGNDQGDRKTHLLGEPKSSPRAIC